MVFDYPYTAFGKLRHFPYKFHWKRGRLIRFSAYAMIFGCIPFSIFMTKATNSPGNKRYWAEKRAARYHTYFEFDPLKERH